MSDANTDTKYRMLFILLTVGLLSALYFHTFIWLVDSWLGDPAYSHGFLVPLISGFIIWKKRHELHLNPFGAGIFVFALGLFIYVAGFFWRAPFGLAISFLIVISGLILYLGGKEAMHSLLFPVCFLFFAIPLPFLPSVANVLQSFSAHYSALVIGMLGIPVTTIGAEIHLAKCFFVIGAPCSGMHTLISSDALYIENQFSFSLQSPLHSLLISQESPPYFSSLITMEAKQPWGSSMIIPAYCCSQSHFFFLWFVANVSDVV